MLLERLVEGAGAPVLLLVLFIEVVPKETPGSSPPRSSRWCPKTDPFPGLPPREPPRLLSSFLFIKVVRALPPETSRRGRVGRTRGMRPPRDADPGLVPGLSHREGTRTTRADAVVPRAETGDRSRPSEPPDDLRWLAGCILSASAMPSTVPDAVHRVSEQDKTWGRRPEDRTYGDGPSSEQRGTPTMTTTEERWGRVRRSDGARAKAGEETDERGASDRDQSRTADYIGAERGRRGVHGPVPRSRNR